MKARVLVVEDDRANRDTLCALLAQMGYSSVPVENGDDALRVLATTEVIDVIISDVVMPGLSGIEFTRRARAARPGVPIILITGEADVLESVLANGGVALLKPYSTDRLRDVLDEALEAPH
jgi:two-component system cell cycle response regulator CpdR